MDMRSFKQYFMEDRCPILSDRARKTYKAPTKEKWLWALKNEDKLAAGLGGTKIGGQLPMDVTLDVEGVIHGVEVKTFIDNSRDKINAKSGAIRRKEKWSKETGSPTHTVVFDDRDTFKGGINCHQFSGNKMYYKRGVGSFRITAMTPVRDMDHMRSLIVGE